MENYTAQDWSEHLKLEKHPEGGYFKEVYRSTEVLSKEALPDRFTGDRNMATSIYFMLTGTDFSAFHRIKSDEGWFFHAGNTSLTIHEIQKNGALKTHHLGRNILQDETLQVFIEAESWFASETHDSDKESFALVGCVVAPAFDFADFELANASELSKQFPEYEALIERLSVR